MSDAPVVIRQYAHGWAAHAARALLEAHDIPCVVVGDDAGGMYPGLGYVRGVRLLVRHADAVRALALLDDVAREAERDAEAEGDDDDAAAS